MHFAGFVIVSLFYQAAADSDGKRWVWSGRGKEEVDRKYTGVSTNTRYTSALVSPSESLFKPEESLSPQATKLRYEVSEPSDYPRPPINSGRPPIYPEEQYKPTTTIINGFRPDSARPPSDVYRPGNRPSGSGYRPPDDGYRPVDNGYRPIDNGYRPTGGSGFRPDNGGLGGGYRPTTGPNGRPILTGPVPSWEQGHDFRYKGYDRCKCVHSFNCNTPGIKFGSCDVDKQYCCYNDIDGGRPHGQQGFISGGVRDRPRPVLAGPGGPVDRPGSYKPYKSDFDYRPYRPNNDYNRYSDSYKDNHSGGHLEEAYRRGLESAIHETYQRPNRFNGRREFGGYQDYYGEGDFNRRPRTHHKYGLYEADFYGGRSANSTIEAENDSKS